jgi:threonine synthase
VFDGRLECSSCGREREAGPRASVCPECGKPLLARYALGDADPDPLLEAWTSRERRERGMWGFRELLPVRPGERPVTLREGGTPLVPLQRTGEELGLRLYAKEEGRNPTGSFKDRGLSAAVSRAVLDGVDRFVVPSAGNAGAALSAYAARAGRPARIYVPRDTPEGVRRRCRRFGAELVEVDGLITDCGARAREHAEETGAFDVSTLREPYRLEGKKTMMLEIARSLGWEAPDAVVYPTGGGTGLIASWKVLGELEELGVLERQTRMYAVQSEGCAPMVRAWEEGRAEAGPWPDADTEAWGLRVPEALGDFLILETLRASGGGAVAVADGEMARGARRLASREGVAASVEGGATLAAARRLRERGELREGERVVLFDTAHFLTY